MSLSGDMSCKQFIQKVINPDFEAEVQGSYIKITGSWISVTFKLLPKSQSDG